MSKTRHRLRRGRSPRQARAARRTWRLRRPRPGDIGWVIQRHGELYHREYGWDAGFEALVAKIAAGFAERHDPARERCWIAERDGENVGCIFLMRESAAVGKLRLFLVEPAARGLGIGKALVEACLRFARSAGYRKVTLWTQSNLDAARHIYERVGFRKVGETPHVSWGASLVAEVWEVTLPRIRNAERRMRKKGRSA